MRSREIRRAAHFQSTARGNDAIAFLHPSNLAASIPAGGTGYWLPLAEPPGPGNPGQAQSQRHSKDVTARKRLAIGPKSEVM